MTFQWRSRSYLRKKKNLHYSCVAAPAEVTAKDHETEHLPPWSLQSNSLIQSGVISSKKWPSLHPNCQAPEMCTSTNALCITQMMDTLIPWESLAIKWIFFFILIFISLLCLAFFCAFLRDHSMSLFFFFLHQSLDSLWKRKIQYVFLTYFLVLREGFFSIFRPPFSFDNCGSLAQHDIPVCQYYVHTMTGGHGDQNFSLGILKNK